jgi:hypothetical protein
MKIIVLIYQKVAFEIVYKINYCSETRITEICSKSTMNDSYLSVNVPSCEVNEGVLDKEKKGNK